MQVHCMQIKIVSMGSANIQDDTSSKLVSVNLDLKDKLSTVRQKLAQHSKVKMNDMLSFANKNSNDISGSSLAEIAREDEENITLENILDNESKTIYLISEPDWRFFKDKLKLEYGRNVTLEKANKRAFTMVDCEMNEVVDGYENSTSQIDLEEDKITKNDFLLIADIDIPNFAKFGVSIGNSNVKNSNFVTRLTYNIIEYNKMSLKFKLEPTTEFIEAIKDVIDSKDPRKFKDIVNEFGQFIPNEVILGGKAYFVARENSEENFGKEVCYNDFNEKDWVESLRDFKNWSCINLKDPVNIFQLLPEDLRKQILSLVGKKIIYTSIEDFTYKLPESGSQLINIPKNILEILQHKDADCNIFATVIDKKEKDIFSCQIIWPLNEDPRLVIHCIQKKFAERICKLKIRWMIIGYDINFDFNRSDPNIKLKIIKDDFDGPNCKAITKPLDLEYDPLSLSLCFGIPVLRKSDDLNNSLVIGHYFFNDKENRKIGSHLFSYCLEKKHFVKLPDFTFYTLVISNYPNSDNYGISTFQHTSKIRRMFNFIKFNSLKSNPKFFSLYSTENGYDPPIFLKQKINGIRIRYINVNYCNQNDCICKSKRFKRMGKNLKYAFLDPKDSN
ncbi:hypothetical protein GLOIN_2v1813311 [Rhizophagus clarus]|uniref:DUF7431 domain-containing protein n=1 Tax=Rhizophagus clarus TaxID=94130 RepID=A0A8H3QZY7_9GLOM|nr:hypothetical protein GLOIN_2v1813311 [Rhizophagus clarus]